MSGEELRCQEVVEILDDYLEGTMPAADRGRLQQHLADCEGCDAYLEQLRTAIRVTGSLGAPSIPPEVMALLLRALRTWRQREHPAGNAGRQRPRDPRPR